jgi:septal ring-binding cell division protein DamX
MLLWLGLGLGAALLLAGGFWYAGRPKAPRIPKATPIPPQTPPQALPERQPLPDSPKPEPAKPEPPLPEQPKTETPKPEPKTDVRTESPRPKDLGISIKERAEALRQGDFDRALEQGKRLVAEMPRKHWTLRLEIACQPETVKRAVAFFEDSKPDLFILPMRLRDGRNCYQVFFGNFPSEAAAEQQAKRLPAAFKAGGNKPKAFCFSDIPSRQ